MMRFSDFVRILLFLALLPLIAVVLVLWLIELIGLYILVWMLWCTRGKDILFVYSDSPIWQDYVEQFILPRIESRSVVLNWSDRRHWLNRFSLPALLFRHLGGNREFNPLAVYFRPLRPHRTFRFWQAFTNRKHGQPETLKQVESDFYACIGLDARSTEKLEMTSIGAGK